MFQQGNPYANVMVAAVAELQQEYVKATRQRGTLRLRERLAGLLGRRGPQLSAPSARDTRELPTPSGIKA